MADRACSGPPRPAHTAVVPLTSAADRFASSSTSAAPGKPATRRSPNSSPAQLVAGVPATPVGPSAALISTWHSERVRRLRATQDAMGQKLSRRHDAKERKKKHAKGEEKSNRHREEEEKSPAHHHHHLVGEDSRMQIDTSPTPSIPPRYRAVSAPIHAPHSHPPTFHEDPSSPAITPGAAHTHPHPHPPSHGHTVPAGVSPGSPSSPITSASPHARRIRSHFAHHGREHNSYALPESVEPLHLGSPAFHTRTVQHPHSPSKSPHNPGSVMPMSISQQEQQQQKARTSPLLLPRAVIVTPVGAPLADAAPPSHSPTKSTQSEEQEAILFSPAYVLPPVTDGPSDAHQAHPIVAVNSIPATVAAQSNAVQSAVAAGHVIAHHAATPLAAAATPTSPRHAAMTSALPEEEFDPFLFIKNLPPLSQAVRTCTVPVLPPATFAQPRITLALDLDETLVHCSVEPLARFDLQFPVSFNGLEYQVYVRTRPHLAEFLSAVAEWFEVVVFTASQQVYADRLLNLLDPSGRLVHHRVFRDSCVCVEGNYLKDLGVLGRDLRRAVIVDNSVQAFGYQLENGIPIESWFDDQDDRELVKLLPFLQHIRTLGDVRPTLRQTFKLSEFVTSLPTPSVAPNQQPSKDDARRI